MSQNLERLFALEGGAKRRVAKKSSKKASKGSKGKKAMKGGALSYDDCITGKVDKDANVDTVAFANASPADLAAINASLNQAYAGSSAPFCKDLKAIYNTAQQLQAKALAKNRAAIVESCARVASSSPIALMKEDNFKRFLTRNGSSCGPASNGVTLTEVKQKLTGGKRKSKKAQKGGKRGSKKASKGSKKASKGKKTSRKH